MKVSVIQIGNSRGVRIPKAFLQQCRIASEIDMRIENNSIILDPINRKPRQNWSIAFKTMHENGDDSLLIEDSLEGHFEDWEWK
ncbi:MAG: peptidase [Candidatus Raymondbacteria bacterium RifOxyC12_full_50_8]|nr:MAG: peptidase [Candidatus Raymondbacteria bacterium RifOxyB12_full_50_8]OGJ94420.1 MAG: peptidase [Candidatus Raymondbacteria bacterium RifOxyC12_full_50_8]